MESLRGRHAFVCRNHLKLAQNRLRLAQLPSGAQLAEGLALFLFPGLGESTRQMKRPKRVQPWLCILVQVWGLIVYATWLYLSGGDASVLHKLVVFLGVAVISSAIYPGLISLPAPVQRLALPAWMIWLFQLDDDEKGDP